MKITKTLLIIALLFIFYASHAQAKKYYIYGDPKNGSKFKEPIYTSDIQMKKRYQKMSDSEKTRVRADYPDLGENDTPPFPVKGLIKIIKPYVKEFRYVGSETIRTLKILISAEGEVLNVRGVNTNDRTLINFIWDEVDKIDFDSAICDGSPCEMNFHLDLGVLSLPFRK